MIYLPIHFSQTKWYDVMLKQELMDCSSKADFPKIKVHQKATAFLRYVQKVHGNQAQKVFLLPNRTPPFVVVRTL